MLLLLLHVTFVACIATRCSVLLFVHCYLLFTVLMHLRCWCCYSADVRIPAPLLDYVGLQLRLLRIATVYPVYTAAHTFVVRLLLVADSLRLVRFPVPFAPLLPRVTVFFRLHAPTFVRIYALLIHATVRSRLCSFRCVCAFVTGCLRCVCRNSAFDYVWRCVRTLHICCCCCYLVDTFVVVVLHWCCCCMPHACRSAARYVYRIGCRLRRCRCWITRSPFNADFPALNFVVCFAFRTARLFPTFTTFVAAFGFYHALRLLHGFVYIPCVAVGAWILPRFYLHRGLYPRLRLVLPAVCVCVYYVCCAFALRCVALLPRWLRIRVLFTLRSVTVDCSAIVLFRLRLLHYALVPLHLRTLNCYIAVCCRCCVIDFTAVLRVTLLLLLPPLRFAALLYLLFHRFRYAIPYVVCCVAVSHTRSFYRDLITLFCSFVVVVVIVDYRAFYLPLHYIVTFVAGTLHLRYFVDFVRYICCLYIVVCCYILFIVAGIRYYLLFNCYYICCCYLLLCCSLHLLLLHICIPVTLLFVVPDCCTLHSLCCLHLLIRCGVVVVVVATLVMYYHCCCCCCSTLLHVTLFIVVITGICCWWCHCYIYIVLLHCCVVLLLLMIVVYYSWYYCDYYYYCVLLLCYYYYCYYCVCVCVCVIWIICNINIIYLII